MTLGTTVKASVRRAIHDQLETERSEREGLSLTNWVLVFLILFSLLLYTAETEQEIQIGQAGAFWLLNIIILCVFCIEFIMRLCVAGVDERFKGWNGLCAYVKSNGFMVAVDFLAFAPELLLLTIGVSPPSWLRYRPLGFEDIPRGQMMVRVVAHRP